MADEECDKTPVHELCTPLHESDGPWQLEYWPSVIYMIMRVTNDTQ